MMMTGLKFALRGTKTNRLCVVIGVLGLGLGLACSIVITKYVWQEYTTNRFHVNYDRLYYCVSRSSDISLPGLSQPLNWNKSIADYPEVEVVTAFQMYSQVELEYNRQGFKADVMAVDTAVGRVFSFSMRRGDLSVLLSDLSNMVVTEHFAKRVFGEIDPVGKDMFFQGLLYKIAGVVEDWPVNSSFDFDVMIRQRRGFNRSGVEFLLLREEACIDDVNVKLAKEVFRGSQKFVYAYCPFRDVHFNNEVDFKLIDSWQGGDKSTLSILSLIGGIILVISLFNYVNLYHVALLGRGKELGVKKVFGSSRLMLWGEFWLENLVMVLMAIGIAGGGILISAGWIERVLNVPVRLNPGFYFLLFGGIVLLLPILISIWPYLKFGRLMPVMVIRSNVAGEKGGFSRQVMLFIQYMMTIVMLIVSFYFIYQLNFMLNSDLGIRQENIVKADLVGWKEMYVDWSSTTEHEEAMNKMRAMEDEYDKGRAYVENELRSSMCLEMACEGSFPFDIYMHPWKNVASGRDYESCSILTVTPGFELLYGLEVKEGRFFQAEKDRDRENKVVINEAAMRWLGVESIDDLWLANNYWGAEKSPWKVIGVVRDFHYEHITRPVKPLVMLYFSRISENIPYMMRLAKGREKEALADLEQLHDKVNG